MPKYLVTGSYNAEGVRGVLSEGGSSRVKVVEQLATAVGGTLESFYFAFGGQDFVIVFDAPTNVDVATIMLAVNASGVLASTSTTVLLTPAEIDEATQKAISYRPPGG